MRKGAKSFVEVSAFTIPAVVVFALLTGAKSALLALLGLFVVLSLANHLDRKPG